MNQTLSGSFMGAEPPPHSSSSGSRSKLALWVGLVFDLFGPLACLSGHRMSAAFCSPCSFFCGFLGRTTSILGGVLGSSASVFHVLFRAFLREQPRGNDGQCQYCRIN